MKHTMGFASAVRFLVFAETMFLGGEGKGMGEGRVLLMTYTYYE
jgi:hypothetical protein